MIIYISLDSESFDGGSSTHIDRLLHEIVDIYIKGRHLLVIERETIVQIRAATTLNRQSEVVLNELYSGYSQTKDLVRTSPVSLQILNIDEDVSRDGTIFKV